MSGLAVRIVGVAVLLAACVGMAACTRVPAGPVEAVGRASEVPTLTPPPRAAEASLSAKDRRAVLALARDVFRDERAHRFADVSEGALTAAEAKQAVLGDIELSYRIAPGSTVTASLFDAAVVGPDYASVPIRLGARKLAGIELGRTKKGWEWSSTLCESSRSDRAHAQVTSSIVATLGGSPEMVRDVDVSGSHWVIARRAGREVAGLWENYAYGCVGDSAVDLPPVGTVLSSDRFKALLARMKSRQ